ncbi:MAG: nucleotidyltransferase domain-containing protein [Candidatus Cryptobacteroides sp.]|nr:nucleotidyltransferase domain-containing protein [Candidatus Cryptobacteroides sp.]
MIQGFEDYSIEQLEEIVLEHITDAFTEIGIDVEIYGSRTRGEAKADSDLDVKVRYKGAEKDYALFNILNDDDSALYIDGIRVDINPCAI